MKSIVVEFPIRRPPRTGLPEILAAQKGKEKVNL
jgi:hypothetical protein